MLSFQKAKKTPVFTGLTIKNGTQYYYNESLKILQKLYVNHSCMDLYVRTYGNDRRTEMMSSI